MDNKDSKIPSLCTAGCGFYGSEMYNNMCSKCYKETNKSETSKSGDVRSSSVSTADVQGSKSSSISNTNDITEADSKDGEQTQQGMQVQQQQEQQQQEQKISRKHARSPSPIAVKDERQTSSAAMHAQAQGSSSQDTTTTTNQRPQQLNKGRCFRCRIKVPLAKQTINKCRCEYVFCDSHRYPDRHDCDVDFGKLDRDTLAKNNPKLHERPKGGRSFQRIDSL